MKDVTYPLKEINVAEINIKGITYKFRIPPATGTHSECFGQLNSDSSVIVATGRNIAAYVIGALDPDMENEWQNEELIRFPTLNYLRVPAVLTSIPRRRKFGDLEGGILIDSDLKGEGIEMQTDVPKDLSGWAENDSKILIKDKRIFVPFNRYYREQWDEDNGAVVGLFEREGAEMIARAAEESGRTYKPLLIVNVKNIKTPKKSVPELDGYLDDRLDLNCYGLGGDRDGCAVGVVE